ncbi:hypothetical protein ITJ57_12085 [Plantibacter sp. VKM Ac-2880]|uniref:hypothetical protein n=1 Tax=Plantibacter sp. VKM Ac-2880 TaxID=2783827 RepID=UPI0018902C36|nr:hypothetical protein [Plantibacter sp. VKM Ac-2880]MBF4569500.1 hypothetical protein [Plantibacter sp. VKM Ac-2880]
MNLFRVPGELEYLTAKEGAAAHLKDSRNERRAPLVAPRDLSGVAAHRLTNLMRAELQQAELAIAYPGWLQNRAVPRLIVTLRYDGHDAFGVARALQRLDLAARRAGAMQRRLIDSEVDKAWPQPLRTHQGGLHVLDARVGSVDILMTVWGALVTIAGSAPISVAALMALSWDVGRGAVHLTKRWQGGIMARPQRDPMAHERVEATQDWGLKKTKALAPVLEKAIANGQGFEFSLTDGAQQLKLTVLPKDSGDR